MKNILYILILGVLGCSGQAEKIVEKSTIQKSEDSLAIGKNGDSIVKLHHLKKLLVVGNFDNTSGKDTIFQHNYSRLTRAEIEHAADPFQNNWDTVVNWFYEQDADTYLTINNTVSDTLHLGIAQGLYCLINIGDNNSDGKDEIAFVIDYLDYSRMNSCKIYSLCKGKWILLKQFETHEGSFDFTGNDIPVFDAIEGYLEKKNGKWVYLDYFEDMNALRKEDVGKMKPLKLDRCK